MQPAIRSGRQALPVTNHLFLSGNRLVLIAPGVTVHIVKYLRPEAWVAISASAERISETSIGAQQLVVVAEFPGLESVDTSVAFAV